ncbi:hypothetical protein CGZ60_03090 [Neisseria animalis]|nr:hypothetical protein CGZ60_03090 [Neisseria animalis]
MLFYRRLFQATGESDCAAAVQTATAAAFSCRHHNPARHDGARQYRICKQQTAKPSKPQSCRSAQPALLAGSVSSAYV